jgi:hypothetical protein
MPHLGQAVCLQRVNLLCLCVPQQDCARHLHVQAHRHPGATATAQLHSPIQPALDAVLAPAEKKCDFNLERFVCVIRLMLLQHWLTCWAAGKHCDADFLIADVLACCSAQTNKYRRACKSCSSGHLCAMHRILQQCLVASFKLPSAVTTNTQVTCSMLLH